MADEHISREAAIKVIQDIINHSHECYVSNARAETAEWCLKKLKELPAADVRPVVTCGKCKYGKYTGTSWFCDKHSGHADKFGEHASYHEYHSKHWFCADGEERNHES